MPPFRKSSDGHIGVHKVGDVVNNTYRLTNTRSAEREKVLYEAKRISDDLPVSVCCLSLNTTDPLASDEVYENEKSCMQTSSDPLLIESFEVKVHGGKRFYVVKALTDAAADPRNESENAVENESNKRPEGSRCAAYRRGHCHLEIDIPSVGLWSMAAVSRIFSLLVWFGIVLWLVLWGIRDLLDHSYGEGTLLSLCSLVFFLIGLYLIYQLPRALFGHGVVVITTTSFYIWTTLELKSKLRNSIVHIVDNMPTTTRLDRFFCKQISGKTGNLSRIEMKESKRSNPVVPAKSLVLWEIGNRHKLDFDISEDEKLWLFSEIREVLDNIRMQEIVP